MGQRERWRPTERKRLKGERDRDGCVWGGGVCVWGGGVWGGGDRKSIVLKNIRIFIR